MATLQAYHLDSTAEDTARLEVAYGTFRGEPGISLSTREFRTSGALVYLSVADATRLRDTLSSFIDLALYA